LTYQKGRAEFGAKCPAMTDAAPQHAWSRRPEKRKVGVRDRKKEAYFIQQGSDKFFSRSWHSFMEDFGKVERKFCRKMRGLLSSLGDKKGGEEEEKKKGRSEKRFRNQGRDPVDPRAKPKRGTFRNGNLLLTGITGSFIKDYQEGNVRGRKRYTLTGRKCNQRGKGVKS